MSISCLDYSLNYIYRFPKTEKELRIQLMKKKYSQTDIDYAIIFLKKKGYINDEKFAKLYIESELIKKWKSIYLVKWKLISKWVDKNIIDNVLQESKEEIKEWIINKIEKEVNKFKIQGYDWVTIIKKLISKGYNLEDIKKYVEIWQK